MQCVYSFAAVFIALAALAPTAAGAQPTIANYQFVGEVRFSRTQSYVTYSADLVNPGPALGAVTAQLTSLAPSIQIVPGQNVLHFSPVPAASQIASSNTFTILVDRTVTFSFLNLQWSLLNPVANAGPAQTSSVGSTVTLNGSASTNPSGIGTLTYGWSFASVPPGSVATITNPNSVMASFKIDVAGNYVVSLTVGNGSASDSATTLITTEESLPVANAGPNQTINVGAQVLLNGSGSSDVNGHALTYSWSFISTPIGSTAFLINPTSVTPGFIPDKAGTYIVQLIVNDGVVNSNPSTVNITTSNTPPVADAGSNQTVNVGSVVQLDGSGSTDVNGNPLTYKWRLITLPAGSHATLSDQSAVMPTFTVDVPGTYVAQLIVNDGITDSAPATVTITTNAVLPPKANAGPNQVVLPDTKVTLSGEGVDPQKLPLTFQWSLITLPTGSAAVLSSTSIADPTFISDLLGTYVAQLIVSNAFVSSAPSTVTITTSNNVLPVANAGTPQTVNVGQTVNLDGSQSSDPNHLPLTFAWVFLSQPAGSTATLSVPSAVNPNFVADLPGVYVLQLIVNNGTNSSLPATVTITAQAMPASVSVASGSPQQATVGNAFGAVLKALVTDSVNHPLTGITVTFTAPGSGPSGRFAGGVNIATTDAQGIASSAVFTANTKAGSYVVVASATGATTSANFALTNLPGPPTSVDVTSGSGQSAQINTAFASPLAAWVTDAFNNSVPNVTVTFTAPAQTGASATFAGGVNSATTNASGVATSQALTANSHVGAYNITASVAGATSANFALTNTTALPAKIAVTGGSGQNAQINTAFGSPLVATVTDSGGNPVPNVTVTFTAPAQTGTSATFAGGVTTATTNAAGMATSAALTANSHAGAYNITASVSGAASTNFSLTNTVGPAATVAVTAGSGQTAQINTAFGSPLVATVTDAGGNPVPNVTVTFTAPAQTGASATFAGGVNTATTNASGVATSQALTANSHAGAYNITASATGATSTSFSLN